MPFAAPKLKFDDPLIENASGYELSIQSTSPGCGQFTVKNLTTREEAQKVFQSLIRGTVVASLNLSTGILIKSELTIVQQDDPLPADMEQPFTCQQNRDLSRIFIVAGEPRFQIPKILDTLRQSLEVGFHHSDVEEALKDPKTALACQLFIDSQFEASNEARLLSLIGVLEVLKDQEPNSPVAQQLVERWIQESAQLDEEEHDSFRSTLKFMKSISISRGIRGVVERHLGLERAREAQKLYGVRSKLVHEGKRPDDLADAVRRTKSIVRDLLSAALTANQSPH